MAKIHEEIIVVKLSKLVRDNESAGAIAGEETVANLEAVVQELVGSDAIVEIIKE
jgi:hypothetical protein